MVAPLNVHAVAFTRVIPHVFSRGVDYTPLRWEFIIGLTYDTPLPLQSRKIGEAEGHLLCEETDIQGLTQATVEVHWLIGSSEAGCLRSPIYFTTHNLSFRRKRYSATQ